MHRKESVRHERGRRPHWCASVCVHQGGEEMRAGRRGASGGKKRQKERGRENSKDESFMAMCHGTKNKPPLIQKEKLEYL